MQKRENGITLVALVITIIILLILAGISIQALTNTGLFAQAEKAKRESEIANIKEQIQLAIYEKQLEPPLGTITDSQLEDILDDYGTVNHEEDGTIRGITTDKGYEILLSEIYSGTTTGGNTQTGESGGTSGGGESQTLASKVQLGEYVTYTPDPVTTKDTAYTNLNTDLTTYSGNTDNTKNTSSTITQEAGLKWRVLDVVDGKVRLISELPTTSKVALEGYNGYNNAVYLLDKTCKTLYSKAGYTENVQNLKIEDIQNKMSTDYSTIDSNYGHSFTPSNKKYPSIFAQEAGQTVNGGATGTLGLSEQTTPKNQTDVNTATSWTVKYTYWNKAMAESDFTNPIYYNLFINNGSPYSTYWMSSRCVSAGSGDASFRVRDVDSGRVCAFNLYDSYAGPRSNAYALRPVITLNSNVLVKTGNGTSATPYEIGL